MWSLRFPAHYSWITGNPEVILRELSENPSLLRRPGFSNDLITVRIADSPIKYPLF
jgi:hypothetical protein